MEWYQLKETVLDPEKRTLLRVNIEDVEETAEVFNILMGNNSSLRREFIENNTNLVQLTYI